LTNGYVDGLEALVTSLGENTDGLEGLLSTITGHVDALEPLFQDLKDLGTADATKQDAILLELGAIKAKLLLDKGQAAAAGSLSVVLASDAALPLPAGAATELTLEAVNTKLPDKIAGRMPVSLDAVSIGLTRAELDATPVVTAPNITRGGGAVDANTQRVTLATDDALAVIVDAVLTRLNAGVRELVTDSTGAAFDLQACSILPTWDAAGNLVSETATNSAGTWIRTHSTNPAGLPGLTSNWVKQ
jgi:hypothetical protein